MFVAVAAAGMLASCSSDSLIAGSDPNIEPTTEERVPIKINVATPQLTAKGATRGIGTVGDVEGGDNVWLEEKVNVFMFKKGTLKLALEDPEDENTALYNNTVLTTPNNDENGIANELTENDTRIVYKYYPMAGNYDFWGYFIDDASAAHAEEPAVPYANVDEYNDANGTELTEEQFEALDEEDKIKTPAIPAVEAVTIGDEEVTVPFNIDGSQDLMVAKAKPTNTQLGIINAAAFGEDKTRFYSAYAARRDIQPDMKFEHLLTRLTFSVLAGNEKSLKKYNPLTEEYVDYENGDIYGGVFVKSITVKSKNTGNIIAAYTGDPRPTTALISFDQENVEDYANFALQTKRVNGQVYPLYYFYGDGEPAQFDGWNNLAQMQALLTVDGAHWDYVQKPTAIKNPENEDQVGESIGGALLVSTEDSYEVKIVLGQYLLVEDSYPDAGTDPVYDVKYATYEKEIALEDGDFAQGYSYNVKITLYGLERIDIYTTLAPWLEGDEISFDAE